MKQNLSSVKEHVQGNTLGTHESLFHLKDHLNERQSFDINNSFNLAYLTVRLSYGSINRRIIWITILLKYGQTPKINHHCVCIDNVETLALA